MENAKDNLADLFVDSMRSIEAEYSRLQHSIGWRFRMGPPRHPLCEYPDRTAIARPRVAMQFPLDTRVRTGSPVAPILMSRGRMIPQSGEAPPYFSSRSAGYAACPSKKSGDTFRLATSWPGRYSARLRAVFGRRILNVCLLEENHSNLLRDSGLQPNSQLLFKFDLSRVQHPAKSWTCEVGRKPTAIGLADAECLDKSTPPDTPLPRYPHPWHSIPQMVTGDRVCSLCRH